MHLIKLSKNRLLFIVSLLIIAIGAQAQQQPQAPQVPDEIVQSLKTGNSRQLSDFFNQNVELAILDNDNVYSKAQAQQIVTNFFAKYQPESFSVLHQGGKEDASHVIGNLKTNGGAFRVYFLLKSTGGKSIIHQLRIEKQ